MTIKAYVLGKITPTREGNIKEELKALPCVKEVDLCFGKYDFVVICEAEDLPALEAGAIEKMRDMEGITSTETLIVHKEKEESVEAPAEE